LHTHQPSQNHQNALPGKSPFAAAGAAQRARGGWRAIFISVKLLINCFWRNEIYYKNALLLRAWSICVVFFVAQKQLINTSIEINIVAGDDSGVKPYTLNNP
jgi:hypothetical protein